MSFLTLLLQIHNVPQTDGDWVAIGPPIENRTKYWNPTSPAETQFQADQIVTVCFKTRPTVDNHKGFSASVGGINFEYLPFFNVLRAKRIAHTTLETVTHFGAHKSTDNILFSLPQPN